jgi:DNA-binding PucR family transcriptional regulator
VAAEVPVIGRHAFPRIETALDGLGIRSAWRLQYDVEVGIACMTRPESQLDRLASALAERSDGCIGISPTYDDLRATRQALQRARIALHGAYSGQRVVVFDRSPLAVAAAGTPEVMERLAATIFSGLDALLPAERSTLLNTFGVWLDNEGSAQRTAELLFCHPNTVRHRIRRLERHTDRSTADPRALAELTLAFEVTRRTA